ncbi:COX15/CtaA family protein [Halomonas almeriensis]|uniref:COX15/CtaA family protein n=1 Tax=Halomonas almeriensis TaxID=308163 RepID=UPI0025B2F075|nr:COX15/CtaA family protein [Halomonas almeriensis]MDN3554042.1 COX15/CtaA family protein [Halomonas almeriensis]
MDQSASRPTRQRVVCWLSLLGMLLSLLVVLAGAWTRLVDAGLGCPDWPGCFGQWNVPDVDTALSHSPGSVFDASKAWMEMWHRYMASLLGVVVVLVVMLGRPLRRHSGYPWRLSLGLLMIILIQGGFGALTVTLRLWPQVVTLHLLGGLAVAGLFLWLHLHLRHPLGQVLKHPRHRGLSPLWALSLGLLVLQLALGGWTSSNYAGLACHGFPACNGEWWPSADWGEGFHLTQTVGPEYLHGQLHAEARTAIHLAHRLGGGALLLSLAALAWRCRREPRVRRLVLTWLGVSIAQSALGASNVLLWLPAWLALLHTAGAALSMLLALLAFWQWQRVGTAACLEQRSRWVPPAWLARVVNRG